MITIRLNRELNELEMLEVKDMLPEGLIQKYDPTLGWVLTFSVDPPEMEIVLVGRIKKALRGLIAK